MAKIDPPLDPNTGPEQAYRLQREWKGRVRKLQAGTGGYVGSGFIRPDDY